MPVNSYEENKFNPYAYQSTAQAPSAYNTPSTSGTQGYSEVAASALGGTGMGSVLQSGGKAVDFDWKSTENLLSPGQSNLAQGAGFGLDSKTGNVLSIIGDPIDMFGKRKKYKKQMQDYQARLGREKAVNALADKYNDQMALQQPYQDVGIHGLSSFGQYQQGDTFQPQLREGSQAVGGGAASAGMYNSSATGQGLSDFVNNLTNEDMNRQYQQQLNAVKIGQGAVGQIGGAGQNLMQGNTAVYGNERNALAQNQMNYANAQRDMYDTIGNIGSGAASYFGSK